MKVFRLSGKEQKFPKRVPPSTALLESDIPALPKWHQTAIKELLEVPAMAIERCEVVASFDTESRGATARIWFAGVHVYEYIGSLPTDKSKDFVGDIRNMVMRRLRDVDDELDKALDQVTALNNRKRELKKMRRRIAIMFDR